MLQRKCISTTGYGTRRFAGLIGPRQAGRHLCARRPVPGCRAVPNTQPLADLAKGPGSSAHNVGLQRQHQGVDQQSQRAAAAAVEAKQEADAAVHASERASASLHDAAQAASAGMSSMAVAAADATGAAAAEAVVAAESADAAADAAVRTAEQASVSPAVTAPAAAAAGAAAQAAGAAAEAAGAAAHAQMDAAVAEAVREAAAADPISEEVVEVVVQEQSLQDRAAGTLQFFKSTSAGKGISIAAGLFLAFTFAIAVYRTYKKYTSTAAVRRRQVDKNKQLVDKLNKYLPDQRDKLTPRVAGGIVSSTGFTPVEVFRKYLWYLLRERPFNTQAVSDMVQLKQALGLDDAQVAEALRERAQRIYDKYGTMMLNTAGMTPEGIERKAACQALYSKMLYLTECQALIDQEGEAFKTTDLRLIFGATDEDSEKLRIVSLEEMSVESLDKLLSNSQADGSTASSGSSGSGGGEAGGNAGQ